MTRPRINKAGHTRSTVLGCVMAVLLMTAGAAAQEATAPTTEPSPKYSEKAQELSESAKVAIDKFSAMVATLLEGVENWIDDMPRYEPPEVLPNGDIIIRRIPPGPGDAQPDNPNEGVTDL